MYKNVGNVGVRTEIGDLLRPWRTKINKKTIHQLQMFKNKYSRTSVARTPLGP